MSHIDEESGDQNGRIAGGIHAKMQDEEQPEGHKIMTNYKKRIHRLRQIGGDELVKTWKASESMRLKLIRYSMSDEQRKVYNEKARLRQAEYRAQKKASGTTKRLKRVEHEKKKVYWATKKKESRERLKKRQRETESALLSEKMLCPHHKSLKMTWITF
jgi:hypothetical protein